MWKYPRLCTTPTIEKLEHSNKSNTINEKLLQILLETDYQFQTSDYSWINNIPNIEDYVKWINYTFTSDNYINNAQYRFHAYLERKGALKTIQDLDKELEKYITNDSPVEVFSEDVPTLLKAIEIAKAQLSNVCNLQKEIKIEKCHLEEKVKKKEAKEKKMETELKTCVDECLHLGSELSSTLVGLRKDFHSLHSEFPSVNNLEPSKLYLNQKTVDEFLCMNDNFEKKQEIVKKCFEMKQQKNLDGTKSLLMSQTINTTVGFSQIKSPSYIAWNVNRVNLGIKQAIFEDIFYNSKNSGVLASIKYLKDLKEKNEAGKLNLDYFSMKSEAVGTEKVGWRMRDEDRKDLEEKCEAYMRCLLPGLEEEELLRKKGRWTRRLSHLNQLYRTLAERSAILYLFYMLIKHEKIKVQTASNVLHHVVETISRICETSGKSLSYLKEKKHMKDETEMFIVHPTTKLIGSMLGLNKRGFIFAEEIISELKEIDQNILKGKDRYRMLLLKYQGSIGTLFQNMDTISSHLFTAPTRRLPLFDGYLRKRLTSTVMNLRSFTNEVSNLHSKLISHQKKLELDKHKKSLNNLWIDFFTRPHEVKLFIENVEIEKEMWISENEMLIEDHIGHDHLRLSS